MQQVQEARNAVEAGDAVNTETILVEQENLVNQYELVEQKQLVEQDELTYNGWKWYFYYRTERISSSSRFTRCTRAIFYNR